MLSCSSMGYSPMQGRVPCTDALWFISDGQCACSQRNRDSVEVGTLTFANIDATQRGAEANVHCLFIAEGAVKMAGLQALVAVMMLRSTLPAVEERQRVILTHILGDLPAVAALMGHAGHGHTSGCPICDIQAETTSAAFPDQKGNNAQTFANLRDEQGSVRSEDSLRAATRAYQPYSRLKRDQRAKVDLKDLIHPTKRAKPMTVQHFRQPQARRLRDNKPLYTSSAANRTSSFQGASAFLMLEYCELSVLSKALDVMHNNYLGTAK